MELFITTLGIIFAFTITALFRWFIIPRLGLLPTEESGFFYQAMMIFIILLIFIGSLLVARLITENNLG